MDVNDLFNIWEHSNSQKKWANPNIHIKLNKFVLLVLWVINTWIYITSYLTILQLFSVSEFDKLVDNSKL